MANLRVRPLRLRRGALRELTAQAGLTQREIARACGVSAAAVGFWFDRDALPLARVSQVGALLGVSLESYRAAAIDTSGPDTPLRCFPWARHRLAWLLRYDLKLGEAVEPTLRHLCFYSAEDLLRVRNLGRGTLQAIQGDLAARGLCLAAHNRCKKDEW